MSRSRRIRGALVTAVQLVATLGLVTDGALAAEWQPIGAVTPGAPPGKPDHLSRSARPREHLGAGAGSRPRAHDHGRLFRPGLLLGGDQAFGRLALDRCRYPGEGFGWPGR